MELCEFTMAAVPEIDKKEIVPPKEKKWDADEDRRNPQYIPKRGPFYEHDDRTAVEEVGQSETSEKETAERAAKEGTVNERTKKQGREHEKRWSHDLYNEEEQAPKCIDELISIYGYNIRNEERPSPAARRQRYGTHNHNSNYKNKEESSFSNTSISLSRYLHDNYGGPHLVVGRGIGLGKGRSYRRRDGGPRMFESYDGGFSIERSVSVRRILGGPGMFESGAGGIGRGSSRTMRGRDGGPGMFQSGADINVTTRVTTRSSSETNMSSSVRQYSESNKGCNSGTPPSVANVPSSAYRSQEEPTGEFHRRTIGQNETSEKEAAQRAAKEGPINERTKKLVHKHENRWSHDLYNEDEQAPKSRDELRAFCGYHIRSEEGPSPAARRRQRYGTHNHNSNYKNKEESSFSNTSISLSRYLHDNYGGPHLVVGRGIGLGKGRSYRRRDGGPRMFESYDGGFSIERSVSVRRILGGPGMFESGAGGIGRGSSRTMRGRDGGPGMFQSGADINVTTRVTTRSSSETNMSSSVRQYSESNKGCNSGTPPSVANVPSSAYRSQEEPTGEFHRRTIEESKGNHSQQSSVQQGVVVASDRRQQTVVPPSMQEQQQQQQQDSSSGNHPKLYSSLHQSSLPERGASHQTPSHGAAYYQPETDLETVEANSNELNCYSSIHQDSGTVYTQPDPSSTYFQPAGYVTPQPVYGDTPQHPQSTGSPPLQLSAPYPSAPAATFPSTLTQFIGSAPPSMLPAAAPPNDIPAPAPAPPIINYVPTPPADTAFQGFTAVPPTPPELYHPQAGITYHNTEEQTIVPYPITQTQRSAIPTVPSTKRAPKGRGRSSNSREDTAVGGNIQPTEDLTMVNPVPSPPPARNFKDAEILLLTIISSLLMVHILLMNLSHQQQM